MKPEHGFTLVELMVTIAVAAVLLALAAPSFYDFILVQRLKSINAQLVTDMQFARSEAASHFERGTDPANPHRNVDVQVSFKPAGDALSCYTIYTDNSANPRGKCDCSQPAGLRCPGASTREIRTVQIPVSLGVRLSLPAAQAHDFAYLGTSGTIQVGPTGVTPLSRDFLVELSIDASRTLCTWVGQSGRPSVCSPSGVVSGIKSCPVPRPGEVLGSLFC